MRAYELMVIFDGDLDESAYQSGIARVSQQVVAKDATVVRTDPWGRRRFAYEIDHKTEGYYVVYEVLAEGAALDEVERSLRLADDVVRHKLIRLPDKEAARRGLVGSGEAAPAAG